MKVQLHPSTGTRRLWNSIIAEYFDYEDRPAVNDDHQIDVPDDCGNRLVEEIPTMEKLEKDSDSDSEYEAEGIEPEAVEPAAEDGDAEGDQE